MKPELNIKVTDIAREQFRAALDAEDEPDSAIRVSVVQASPVMLHHDLEMAPPDSKQPEDLELVLGDVKIWIDPRSANLLEGATIDYLVDGLHGEGFKFDNPNDPTKSKKEWTDPVAIKFQELLDKEINPNIASHGGIITLLDFKDSKAYVHMGGGCQGCGMASVTLRQGIEARVAEVIPEVHAIIDTTDHASGDNPYYQPDK